MSSFSHLVPDCRVLVDGQCYCWAPVKQGPSGRWFITMGHAGFNSPSNNRDGYQNRFRALKAHAKYAAKARRAK